MFCFACPSSSHGSLKIAQAKSVKAKISKHFGEHMAFYNHVSLQYTYIARMVSPIDLPIHSIIYNIIKRDAK